MRLVTLLLALAAVVRAEDYDADTRAGMEAEVREDWAAAVLAFQHADEARVRGSSGRLRYAKTRAKEFWDGEIAALVEAEAWPEAARAVALTRLLGVRPRSASKAKRGIKKAGLEIPDLETDPELAARLVREGRFGASSLRARAIVESCLAFLLGIQGEDGSWDCDKFGGQPLYDVGVTGLALQALLAAGQLEGERAAAAKKAAEYLAGTQTKDGCFGTKSSQHYFYNCVVAAEALAEYKVATGDGDKRLGLVLERAANLIAVHQSPGAGWRYDPGGHESDTSLTSRAITAARALERAGAPTSPAIVEGGHAWLNAMLDKRFAQFGYNMRGGTCARPKGLQERFPPEWSSAMNAAGALAWIHIGAPSGIARQALQRVQALEPSVKYPDLYYWALGARALHAGRMPAHDWYRALLEGVLSIGHNDGGIGKHGPWSWDGGRVYTTAACVLALRLPLRASAVRTVADPAAAFRDSGECAAFVTGSARAVSTGVYLDTRDRVRVTASGKIIVRDGGKGSGPAGVPGVSLPRLDNGAPFGCLLGRIGSDGKPFVIGDGDAFTTKTPGQLYLLINDENLADNSESLGWRVTIKREE